MAAPAESAGMALQVLVMLSSLPLQCQPTSLVLFRKQQKRDRLSGLVDLVTSVATLGQVQTCNASILNLGSRARVFALPCPSIATFIVIRGINEGWFPHGASSGS